MSGCEWRLFINMNIVHRVHKLNKYKFTLDQKLAGSATDAAFALSRREHFFCINLLHGRHLGLMSYEKSDCQLMHIYLKNSPARFHPDPI